MDTHIGFAAVQQKNGTITIPAQLRRRFGLDRPGAQVEIVVRDGEIVLLPHIAVPADQAWFWTKDWQAKEREADADLAAGRYTDHDTADDLLAHLEGIPAAPEDRLSTGSGKTEGALERKLARGTTVEFHSTIPDVGDVPEGTEQDDDQSADRGADSR